MLHRKPVHVPEYVYPREPWRLVERRFHPRLLAESESTFALGNGYLGIRGCFEEGRPVHQRGTFVNGFYETWPIVYGEEAFGFAKTGQTIVNVTDGTPLKLYVDDEPFFLPTARLEGFERALDMRAGTLDREILWETPSGKQVSIRSRRLVSFRHRHLAAISYEVTLLNDSAPVLISSEISTPEPGQGRAADPRRGAQRRGALEPGACRQEGTRIVLGQKTRGSRMSLACGIHHLIETACPHAVEAHAEDTMGQVVFKVDARPGLPIRVVKLLAYHTSRHVTVGELCQRAGWSLDRAAEAGFEALLASQRAFLDDFWRRSDVEASGNDAIQQALRFNLFQMCQATARAEGVGVPAKGLTGEGYEGHYFWDCEIYVLPFLTYTAPRIARNLLLFRHSQLDKARQRAREVNQKGALFPWRTISGDEASAYYAAGTAQYHIDADIAYAIRKYVEATGDVALLFQEGAEILVETARLWADLGFFSEEKDGRFCIHGVTGPDEYNTVVDNNAYTNLMARENLAYAAETVRLLYDDHFEHFKVLEDRTGVSLDEVEAWERAAERMYVPYDETLQIHPQDDDFLHKEPWDFEGTPPERYPLLLHYHPLVIVPRLRACYKGALTCDRVLFYLALPVPWLRRPVVDGRARDVPPEPPLHAGREEAVLRVLRPAHHGGLVAVGVDPGDRGGRAGRDREGEGVRHLLTADGPRQRPRQRPRRAPHRLHGRNLDGDRLRPRGDAGLGGTALLPAAWRPDARAGPLPPHLPRRALRRRPRPGCRHLFVGRGRRDHASSRGRGDPPHAGRAQGDASRLEPARGLNRVPTPPCTRAPGVARRPRPLPRGYPVAPSSRSQARQPVFSRMGSRRASSDTAA